MSTMDYPATDASRIKSMIRDRYVQPQPMGGGRAAVGMPTSPMATINYRPTPPPAPAPAPAGAGAPPAPAVAPVALPQTPGAGSSYDAVPDWGWINRHGGNVPGNVNFGSGFLGTLNDILRNFSGGGAFGDQPNPALLAGVRSQAEQTAAGQRDHAALLAQAMGLDPSTAASLGLRADLGASGDYANTVNNAVTGELGQKQDFGQKLLMGLLTGQAPQNAYNPASGPQWLSALGSLYGGVGNVIHGAG